MTHPPTASRRIDTARQRGMAMLLVMIAVVMASILGMGFLVAQSTNVGITQNIDGHTRARSIAESGLALTLQHIQSNPDWRDSYSQGTWVANQNFQGGSFTVTVYDGLFNTATNSVEGDGDFTDDISDTITVAVTATFNGVTHTVRSNVTPGVTQSRSVLFITPNASSLTDQDALKVAQLEAWGFAVSALSDSASSGQYATAIAENDVVYVSEEADSGDVGSKLDNASIGVVLEESYLFDQLGLTASNGNNFNDDTIVVVNDGHYITRVFASGELQIATGSASLITAGVDYSSGATILAKRDGLGDTVSPTLAVLDASDATYAGGVAMGRRVFLPVGGGSFDFAALNDDGLTLIKRSLEWAATEPENPVTSGLTARWFEESRTLRRLSDIDWARDEDFATTETEINFPSTRDAWYDWLARERFGVEFTGQLQITTAGTYGFELNSDDGSDLVINGTTIVNNDGLHGMRKRTGSYYLSEGTHDLAVRFFENGGGAGVILSWRPPGESSYTVVPATAFATSEEETPAAQLIAEYDFEPVTVSPTLVAHWKLDEYPTGTMAGFSFVENAEIKKRAIIDAYRSSEGAYDASQALAEVVLTNNNNDDKKIKIKDDAVVRGHIYSGPNTSSSEGVELDDDVTVEGNVGRLDQLVSLPAFTAPDYTSLTSDPDDVEIEDNDSVVWTSDQHHDDIEVKRGSLTIRGTVTVIAEKKIKIDEGTLTIDGHATIFAGDDVQIDEEGEVILTPGSTLKLYLLDGKLDAKGSINASGTDPGAVEIYGSDDSVDIQIEKQAIVKALIYNPLGKFDIKDDAQLFGGVVANEFKADDDAQVHIDLSNTISGLGSVAADEQQSNNGFLRGARVGEDGQHLRATSFDGEDDYMIIHHADAFLLDRGTVAFWFKADTTSGNQGLWSKDSTDYDDGGHLSIYIENGKVEARIQSVSSSHRVDTGSSSLSAGTWHHVAVQFGPMGLRIYLDGELKDTDSYTGGLGATSGGTGNTEPIVLGASTQTSDDNSATPLRDYFSGLIDDVRIYDQPLDDAQLANIMLGNEPGERVAPAFEIEDSSGFGTPLSVFLQDTDHVAWIDGGGLEVSDETLAASITDASKITSAIQATNAITVEAIFNPANTTQDGPARIVSLSQDTGDRNFTLGQDDADTIFRLRSTDTNSNGDPDVVSEDNLTADSTAHVIITYDGEYLRIYRNGELEVSEDRTGLLSAWDTDFKLAFFNELTENRPWLGKLYRVAIYDQALNDLQIDNVFNGLDPGDPTADGSIEYQAVWVEH